MSTQSLEMYQLVVEQYKAQTARLKQLKEKLCNQSGILDRKIQKQLQNLNQTSQIINKSANNRIKLYIDSLEQGFSSSDLIEISNLSSYLKTQKSNLSKLISSQTNGKQNQKSKSGRQLLHDLNKRKKIQKYYERLQCLKIEKEIQYLQNHIFIGKPTNAKQAIVYDNVQGVTLKEEQQLKQKMKILLNQLERVVCLSNQCGGSIDKSLNIKMVSLKLQAQRLQKVEQLVDKQTKQIIMVKDFFNSHNPTEAIQLLQQKIQEFENNHQQGIKLKKRQNTISSINDEELKFLMNFKCQPFENIKVYKKPFDQVNDLLASCKAKLKKVKI